MAADTAVIVGAGIGGLSAALALSARGCRVTLVERRTRLTEIGAGLQLSPNASRILNGFGLENALRRVASEPERVVIRRIESGRRVGEVALGPYMRERFGAPYLVILRAELQTLLLDAVRACAEVRLMIGRNAIAVDDGSEAAEVVVENATGARESLRGDVVIGADGLRSTIRASWDKRAPVYRGSTAFRATLSRDDAPDALRREETGLWLGPGHHVVHYPIASGRIINVVAVLAAPEPAGEDSEFRGSASLTSVRQHAPAPLGDLLAAAQDWSAWPLYDLPVRRMARGRIALVGDAAHPVLPFLAQGAALAIEDAAVLARCLGGQDGPARALRRYEKLRRARAERVQVEARRNGRTYHAGALVGFARDRVMGVLGPQRMAERYAWLYGWSPDSA